MHTRAMIAYAGRAIARPRYYANDHSRDVLDLSPVEMDITDARGQALSLDGAGFALLAHRSAVADFMDRAALDAVYRPEIAALIEALSGADLVLANGPAILRFSERSRQRGGLDNPRPARFAHVDVSDATARAFAERVAPAGQPLKRFAYYNVWRVLSAPPQDVPLAVCDARSVAADDLIAADAVFDAPGKPQRSFEAVVLAHAPRHRWHWFPEMHREEALVFKTHDSAPQYAHCVPHVAFDNSAAPEHAPPRASLDMQAVALWFA